MKLKELIENSEFDVNCHYLVYDCTEENDWHTAPVVYDNWGKDTIEPELLEKSIKYITVGDDRAIVIEVKGGKPSDKSRFVVEIVYDPKINKLRAQANDHIHGKLWCNFPTHLKHRDGEKYYVAGLEHRYGDKEDFYYVAKPPFEPIE